MTCQHEFYFCLKLTSDEHYIVQSNIEKECCESGLVLLYYRQLKEGHVAMYREVKVCSVNEVRLGKFKKWLHEQMLDKNMEDNPHSTYRKMLKQGRIEEASEFAGNCRLFFNKKV